VNTAFRESFDADLSDIADAALLRRIKKVIEQVEAARTFQQIPNLKRLEATGKITVFAWVIIASALFSSEAR
jgi:hypothetical protein